MSLRVLSSMKLVHVSFVALAAALSVPGIGWSLQAAGTAVKNQVPTITFTWSLSTANPPYYSISITPMGSTSYKSLPNSDQTSGDPYVIEFTASQAFRNRIFELIRQLNFLRGKYHLSENPNPRFVSKSLTYNLGTTSNQVTYSSATDPRINELTRLFQQLSVTANTRRLVEKGISESPGVLARQLRLLDQQNKSKRLVESQLLAPVLQQIAADSGLTPEARRYARSMLRELQGHGEPLD